MLPPPTLPPAVVLTGTYQATVSSTIAGVAPRVVTLTLVQGSNGILSGTATSLQLTGTVESVLGTVSGHDVTLYIGNPCGACTLATVFTGTSATGAQIDGTLVATQEAASFVKQ